MVSGGKQFSVVMDNSILTTHNSTLTRSAFSSGKPPTSLHKNNLATLLVYVRVPNGNISSHSSRRLIEKLKDVIADDVRVTINQGLQFRFIKPEHLEYVYQCFG
jgi:sulfite reductase beta subunit-like hemoprotein